MQHPCLKMKIEKLKKNDSKIFKNKNFVANSTLIGTEEEPGINLLVTGPNMGGKSTLLR